MNTTNIQPGLKSVATRIENARRDFAEVLANLGGISAEEGAVLVDIYLKAKFAKLDAVAGRISVKHGGSLDRSFIRSALQAALSSQAEY